MNILLIEPDKPLADTYQKALQKAGYQVNRSADVQTAIDIIDQKIPDVILLEIQQNTHNGIEFLYELRSYPEWQSIPIIVASIIPEHDIGLTKPIKKQLNIKSYYYKPRLSLDELVRAIEAVQ